MTFNLDPTLEYQQDAAGAASDLFDGQHYLQTGAAALQSIQIGGLFQMA